MKKLFAMAMVAGVITLGTHAVVSAGGEKTTICHAAGQAGTTHFNTLHLPDAALSAHFDENGSPQAGHEQDYFGECQTSPATTEPPVDTTEPPVETTQPPEESTTTTTIVATDDPPVPTDPSNIPAVVIPDDCPVGEYPASYTEGSPCVPGDPCLTNDGILYTTGVSYQGGDQNDRYGSTLWGVDPCFIAVSNPITPSEVVTPSDVAAPSVQAPLPVTGTRGIMVMLLISTVLFSGGLLLRKVSTN